MRGGSSRLRRRKCFWRRTGPALLILLPLLHAGATVRAFSPAELAPDAPATVPVPEPKDEVAAALEAVDAMRRQVRALGRALAAARKSREVALANAARLEAEVAALGKQLEAAAAERRELIEQRLLLEARLDDAEQQIAELTRSLDQAWKERDAADAERLALVQALETARRERDQRTAELESARATASRLEHALAAFGRTPSSDTAGLTLPTPRLATLMASYRWLQRALAEPERSVGDTLLAAFDAEKLEPAAGPPNGHAVAAVAEDLPAGQALAATAEPAPPSEAEALVVSEEIAFEPGTDHPEAATLATLERVAGLLAANRDAQLRLLVRMAAEDKAAGELAWRRAARVLGQLAEAADIDPSRLATEIVPAAEADAVELRDARIEIRLHARRPL